MSTEPEIRLDAKAADQPARLYEKIAALRIVQAGLLGEDGKVRTTSDLARLREIYEECEGEWREATRSERRELRARWNEMLARVDEAGETHDV